MDLGLRRALLRYHVPLVDLWRRGADGVAAVQIQRRYGYGDEYQILRERYARGEITREQFDQMTRDLDQHQNQP